MHLGDLLENISPINKLLFFPPNPPNYSIESYPDELCNLDGVLCLALIAPSPSTHLIIYSHGNSTDLGMCRSYLQRVRDSLAMHIIAVEFPGYGVSGGRPTEVSIDNALNKVLKFVQINMKWPLQNIVLIGRSIGTGPAVKLATKERIGALVLLAAFKSIRSIAEMLFGKSAAKIVGGIWNNEENIKKVQCPVLFIHGSIDKTIPPVHSVELFKQCSTQNKDIHIINNIDHNRYNWKDVVNIIHNFFTKFEVYNVQYLHRSLTLPRKCFEEWDDHGKSRCRQAYRKKNVKQASKGNPRLQMGDIQLSFDVPGCSRTKKQSSGYFDSSLPENFRNSNTLFYLTEECPQEERQSKLDRKFDVSVLEAAPHSDSKTDGQNMSWFCSMDCEAPRLTIQDIGHCFMKGRIC